MYLVQVLLPVASNDGRPFDPELFAEVRRELTEKFGGVTVYSQAPAQGLWRRGEDVMRDSMVLFEVMQEQLRRKWWRKYREHLRKQFEQLEIVVRAQRIRLL